MTSVKLMVKWLEVEHLPCLGNLPGKWKNAL